MLGTKLSEEELDKVVNKVLSKPSGTYCAIVINYNHVKDYITLTLMREYKKQEDTPQIFRIYVRDDRGVIQDYKSSLELKTDILNMVNEVCNVTTLSFPFTYVFETGEFETWYWRVKITEYSKKEFKSKKYAYQRAIIKKKGLNLVDIKYEQPKKYVDYTKL